VPFSPKNTFEGFTAPLFFVTEVLKFPPQKQITASQSVPENE
jgi:hypothetical protein